MAVRPIPGETIVQETRTRVEPKAQQNDHPEQPRASMWDYIASLTDADWASGNYKITVERGRKEAKGEERSFVCEVFSPLTPADIAKQYGGGEYTIWFKVHPKGQQLRDKVTLKIDGPPIFAPAGGPTSSNGQQAPAHYGDPLSRLIDVMDRRLAQMEAKLDATGIGAINEATRQAMTLNSQVFGSALPAVGSALEKLSGGGKSESPLMEKLMTAAIDRLLAPPSAVGPVSNSVKDFLEMLTAVKTAGLLGSSNNGTPMMQLAIEGIRTLPAAISEGVKGLEQWHLAEEARARTMAMQRGMNPQPINVTPQPATAAPPPPPPVNGGAAANPSPGAGPTVQVNIETIEIGLVQILTNQAYTIEEAAHRSAAFMQDLVPGMPDQLAAAGEAQILNLFQTRPILMKVPLNPRLTEFIKKFIEVVKSAPIMAQTQPPAVPPA